LPRGVLLWTVLLVRTLMLAKLHTSPLPQPPHVMFLLKAITLRHSKLVDRIASSLLYQWIRLSFNTERVLPRVCLVLPPQRQKPKGRVHAVTTCWFSRILKTQMVLLCLCQVLLSPVPPQLARLISHSIHQWSYHVFPWFDLHRGESGKEA
jgi:hypothetical protein